MTHFAMNSCSKAICMFCWFAEKLIFSDLLFVYRSAEGA